MVEGNSRIKIGIDYDGVVIKKASSWDIPRRASKMGLPNLPGAIEGIDYLQSQQDVDVMGVYTVRPEWLRKRQTDRQIRRRQIPLEKVTHTTNSPKEKIKALLMDSLEGFRPREISVREVEEELIRRIGKIVLVDDSIQKVVDGAKELLWEHPAFIPLLKRFVLVAFNPKQPEKLQGMIVPGVVHIVSMRSWNDVRGVLNNIRSL